MKQLNTELVKFMNWYKLSYPRGTDKTSSMIVHEYLQKNGFREQVNYFKEALSNSFGVPKDILANTSEFEVNNKWWEIWK